MDKFIIGYLLATIVTAIYFSGVVSEKYTSDMVLNACAKGNLTVRECLK